MDTKDTSIATVLCFILTIVSAASAINCFSCESVYDSNCGEDFDQRISFKLDCSRISPPRYFENNLAFKNSTACIKRKYSEQGVQKIVRSCFFGDANDTSFVGCKMDPMSLATQVVCSICNNENYCNGSRIKVKNEPTIAVLLCALLVGSFVYIDDIHIYV